MILDKRNEFADATALDTGGTGLALVGSVIDLSVARSIFNAAKPVYLVVQIDTAVAADGGASSVEFQLVSDAQEAIAEDGTATVHAKTASVAKASLVAGYTFVVALPPEGSVPYERFLGILQNVATNAVTAGKINAFLTLDPPQWKAYDDGFSTFI